MILSDSDLLPEDAERWRSTGELLARLLDSIPRTDWLPSAPVSGDLYPDDSEPEAVARNLRKSYHEALPEVCEAIVAWLQEIQLPSLSQPARYWLLHSVNASAQFCDRQIVSKEGKPTTIVPFPKLQPMQVAYWLLIEWWSSVGMSQFLILATSAPMLYYCAHQDEDTR